MTKWHHHALWLDFKASGLDCSGLDKQLNQLQTGSIVPRTVLPTDAAAIPYKRDTAGVFAIPEHPHISKQSLSRQVTLCISEQAACSSLDLRSLQI